jgi:integrase
VVERLSEHVGRRHQGYVLHRDGQPVTHGMFNHAWRATVLAAELGDLVTDPRRKSRVFVGPKFHDLRHAFASMLIAAGCSVKAVQNALGHASASTTLDLYAHIWPGDEDRIRQAVDRAIAGSAEDRLRTKDTGH